MATKQTTEIPDQVHRVGKRKTSVARVYLRPRKTDRSKITINERPFEEFFKMENTRALILQPFEVTQTTGMYDLVINVKGGGISGQAGATRHGIARALERLNPELRGVLKKAGFLTRDPRAVERKKYGLSGARKRYQYSKR